MGNLANLLRCTPFALAVAVAVSGCSSSGPQRLDTATAGVADTRAQLESGAEQVDAVVAAMNGLLADDADLKRAFDKYRKEIDRLEARAKKVRAQRAAMETRLEDHVNKWRSELEKISSDEARQVSARRQAQLENALGQVSAELDALKSSYDPFVSNLRDIELILANDLSVGGLDATRPLIENARRQAGAVRREITDANQALAAAIAEFER